MSPIGAWGATTEEHTMRRPTLAATAAALAVLAVAGPPAALADDDRDVQRTARCSMGSTVKLDLSPEDGRVEVEIEVDENRTGSRWSVVANRNGARVLSRSAVTRAPSGSFEVRRVVAPGSPRTRVVAVARRAATGEVCRVTATL
jgi:hypothetical protein